MACSRNHRNCTTSRDGKHRNRTSGGNSTRTGNGGRSGCSNSRNRNCRVCRSSGRRSNNRNSGDSS
eukprot:8164063-Pyramimonas_sp.AAC.1